MMPRDNFANPNEESMVLRGLDIVRRRRVIAVVVFMVMLACTLSFALYLPNLYRATASALVERPVSEQFVRTAVTGELEGRLHVIKQEVLSRARLSDLIRRYNLYPELRRGLDFDPALDQMRRDIDVEPSGPEQLSGKTKTVAFTVSYTGRERGNVANVANDIVNFYVSQNDEMRSQAAGKTTQFLRQQLDEAKTQLDQQESKLRAYTASHSGELPQDVQVNLATLERLNTQLRLNSEQQIRTLEQRQRLSETFNPITGAMSRPGEPESAASDLIEQKKQELNQLETRFTSKHPDVVRLKQEIAALEASQAKPLTTLTAEDAAVMGQARGKAAVMNNLDNELQKQKKEETDLRATITNFERRLESVPARQQEFALVSRDHAAAQELYNSLLTRSGEAQVAESMEIDRGGERFRILETAAPPADASAPNRVRLLAMGFIMAFVAAFVAVLAMEQFDTSFHSLDELRKFTSVPVLAAIPRMHPRPATRVLKTAWATGCLFVVLALTFTLAAHMARGNEQIVRLLVRS
jgi:polysaccharide chain length determinant protein (PEP-CTERM system associated)